MRPLDATAAAQASTAFIASIRIGGSSAWVSPTAAINPPILSCPVTANQPARAAIAATNTPLIEALPVRNRPSSPTLRYAPSRVCRLASRYLRDASASAPIPLTTRYPATRSVARPTVSASSV